MACVTVFCVMAQLREVRINDVIHPNFVRESEDTFVCGVVPTAKRNDRPLQTYRPNVGRVKKTSMDSAFDRLVIIGEVGSSGCFAVISASSQESSNLFRDPVLSIGCLVNVLEPVFSGFCLGNDKSNPIFEVRRALQVVRHMPNMIASPIVVNPLTVAMNKFQINNVQLSFIQALVASPTCSGVFCDRKASKSNTCACIQKSPISSWAVSCRIFTADIDNIEDDPFSGEVLQSLLLSKLFCNSGTLALPASEINITELRACVGRVQIFVNDNGGWSVTGFFKCGQSDENIVQNINRVQICRIHTNVLITDNLKYGGQGIINPEDDPLPPLHHANMV